MTSSLSTVYYTIQDLYQQKGGLLVTMSDEEGNTYRMGFECKKSYLEDFLNIKFDVGAVLTVKSGKGRAFIVGNPNLFMLPTE